MQRILALLALPVLFFGCSKRENACKFSDEIIRVSRLTVKKLACVDCSTIKETGDEITTDKVTWTDSSGQSYNFGYVIGPHTKVVSVEEDHSLYLCKGWVYVWDEGGGYAGSNFRQWVHTSHVTAGADASALIVKMDPDSTPPKTTVYGIRGTLHAKPNRGNEPSPIYLLDIQYFDATDDQTVNPRTHDPRSTSDRLDIRWKAIWNGGAQ